MLRLYFCGRIRSEKVEECYMLYFTEGSCGMIRKVVFVVFMAVILHSAICAAQVQPNVEIYINHQKVDSDVPPVIYEGRTLVPLRVISEYLGASVAWDGQSKTVRVSADGRQIVLKINDSEAQVDKNTVLLDVPAMIINGRTMVPLRFAGEALMAEVSWDGELKRVDVVKQLHEIVDFSYTAVNNVPSLLIKGNAPLEYTVAGYDGERVVVDLKAKLKTPRNVLDVGDSALKRVIASELYGEGANFTRFVLELSEGSSFYIFRPDQNSVAVAVTNVLSSIEINEEDGALVARLRTAYPAAYSYFTLGSPENGDYRLVVDISNASLSASKPVIFDNNFVKDVRVSQFTVNPYVARVVFDLKTDLNYRVWQDGNEILAAFSSREMPSRGGEPSSGDESPDGYKDGLLINKIIVVDPGHGGSDPGAVYSNVNEKDLNLDIALRLKQLLEESGARVLMTRESDIYVNLYTRADIANQVGADLFVSIHNNASTNASTSGTMTLYYPSPEKKVLAKILQKAVVETLGLPDLGISERPNLVVTRETKMPSALVEVAFMSNQKDLALLQTEEFRQRAAEGIYKGILMYFSEK